MKNILNILKHDSRKLTSSVVAIITIMGLCIVPCLYAWFNIFSNWAPYESDATGRIRVAVANDDLGDRVLGLDINVGEKIAEALKANDAIGWEFVENSDDAVEGVYSGDYYAALIVPEDFTMDALSFATGELKNPKLIYYENEKKNAIAPKITGKAKTAVQEQVNAAFIETLAKYVSDAASVADAAGYNPQTVFADLGTKMDNLNARLEDAAVMLRATQGLADSAASLMSVSDQLLEDAETAVGSQEAIVGSASDALPDTGTIDEEAVSAIEKEKQQLIEDNKAIREHIAKASESVSDLNKYVADQLPDDSLLIDKMIQSCKQHEKHLTDMGFTALAAQFRDTRTELEGVQEKLREQKKTTQDKWDEKSQELKELQEKLDKIEEKTNAIDSQLAEDLGKKLDNVITRARRSMSDAESALADMQGDLSGLESILSGYSSALDELEGSLNSTGLTLNYIRNGISTLAELFNRIAGNQSLKDVNDVLVNDEASVAEYLASPVKMKTEVIYPIREYGSAMAPFYTVLAQWVGALLTAVLIRTNIKKRDDLPHLRMYECFFGRYALYLFIGLAQALIVSIGDLLYIGIQCMHPILFVLQACMNGIVFMMINYALVFSLENIGLGAGVIILVLQVAGSGGTYPVEVLPKVFRVLYPAMPFRYSMDAMRECIAGTYDHVYAKCMGILFLFFAGAAIFGLLMRRPASFLNRVIAESKEKTEIML